MPISFVDLLVDLLISWTINKKVFVKNSLIIELFDIIALTFYPYYFRKLKGSCSQFAITNTLGDSSNFLKLMK